MNFYIDPSTYSSEGIGDLNKLKFALAERGVTVHMNMIAPSDSYEVFIDGIGTERAVVAKAHGIVYEDTTVEDVADYIANHFSHFAFYKAEKINLSELISEKTITAFMLHFAAW